MKVNRVYHGVATDEAGCALFGRFSEVKVHKMQWLGNVSVDKEYRSMVLYLDAKEEVDRLLAKMTVTMANGECAYTRPCYRCHLYCHLHYHSLPLPSAGSNLWTVCTSRPCGIVVYLDDL
jgi:hypothetical protein